MTEDPEEGMLSWDESVFRDEHVFEIDYVPESFLHRETQMESLKYALRPAVRGSRPLNVMAQGPPGTGKTTALQIMFDELRGQTGIEAVRVNCQVNSTRYSVFSRLFEGVFDYEPPSSGISFKKLFSQVTDRLVDENRVLVVALDDVNYLFYESEASDTLYSLLRAHEEQGGAKIGVIVVSSDLELDMIEALDGRVQSVFRPEEVYFPKYDEPEIGEILRERVRRGFHDGVVDAPVLDRVAELTADQGGDLRVGIDLLRRAGLKAEMRASRTVEPQDVEAAYDTSKYVSSRAGCRVWPTPSGRSLRSSPNTTASAPATSTRRSTTAPTSGTPATPRSSTSSTSSASSTPPTPRSRAAAGRATSR